MVGVSRFTSICYRDAVPAWYASLALWSPGTSLIDPLRSEDKQLRLIAHVVVKTRTDIVFICPTRKTFVSSMIHYLVGKMFITRAAG